MDHDTTTAQLAEERREQLRKYRAVFAETYGYAIDPTQHEAQDARLCQLIAERDTPSRGELVVIDAPAQLAGTTGILLSTEEGWAMVKPDRGGAIYRVRTSDVRVTGRVPS